MLCLAFLHASMFLFLEVSFVMLCLGVSCLDSCFHLYIHSYMLRSRFLHHMPFSPFLACVCVPFYGPFLIWLHPMSFLVCLGATMWVRLHLDDVGMHVACLIPFCLALLARAYLFTLVCAL